MCNACKTSLPFKCDSAGDDTATVVAPSRRASLKSGAAAVAGATVAQMLPAASSPACRESGASCSRVASCSPSTASSATSPAPTC